MASSKKYWKSVEELNENSSIVETLKQNEFVQEIPTDEFLGNKEALETSSTTRRDFLKYVGFTTAAASLAACEGPVIKSIPYVVHPDEIVPGLANFYATTVADGFDFASILVKTREGRPIKIENNALAGTKGGANARLQGSVLSLYDKNRLQGPLVDGEVADWDYFNPLVATRLDNLASSGSDVVLLTQTFASPSTSKLIKELTSKYSNIRHVTYDTVSSSEALDAFQMKYGERALADYDFAKAEVIVSVGADFLVDWQGGGYDAGYAKGRVPKDGKMSRHIQFESLMTLSGANADKRVPVTPAQQKEVLKALAGNSVNLPEGIQQAVANARRQLQKNSSKAVVVCGLMDVEAQTLALEINESIGSQVIDIAKPRMIRQGKSQDVLNVIQGVKSGAIKGLITVGVDPLYSFPNAVDFTEAYKNLEFTLAFAMRADATASEAQFVAATPHYLESWGDVQIKKGHFALTQPTIRPLFNTKQFQECVLSWLGEEKSYYEFIKDTAEPLLGETPWNQALHDGVFASNASVSAENETVLGTMESASSEGALATDVTAEGDFDLIFYTKTNMGDGQNANNPWLQEMPDPISRTSWDNYLTISAADAKELDLINKHVATGALNGSYVNIMANGVTLEKVPVLIQPGQARGTVGLAFGFGKTHNIQKEMQVGVNAYSLYNNFNGVQRVSLEKAGGEHEFACVQLHNTMMGRGDIIRETTLEIFNTADQKEWNAIPMVALNHISTPVDSPEVDLWQAFDRSIGHHFKLSIDLNACTGCGACVIACHAENNVPVVGKTEIRRSRDMHWLRIDRYYSSEETINEDVDKKNAISGLGESLSQFGELENPSENPQVAFQPVMCQHCNHAPCETVCPVAATTHGRQGQNQMTYNRCVGTRYCANNCPYKVRRFNWFLYSQNDEFDYHLNNDLGRMVVNPDVTVRSRGVMEKCSMCIQKTQMTILDAKKDGRQIKDGEFQTACSAACDKGAMVFGDVNDEKSLVAEKYNDKRRYHLIEYLGTKPNVMYQVKVRNTEEV
jgi:molybdopterin-containing oxidoreductase family iron-sulfur binding subunit